MPSPEGDSSHEWLELKGLGDSCSLNACAIIQSTLADPYDSSGYDAADKWLVFDEQTEDQLQIVNGQYLLLAKVPSDDVAAGVTWTNADGSSVSADYLYGYTKLYQSSEPRYLHHVRVPERR